MPKKPVRRAAAPAAKKKAAPVKKAATVKKVAKPIKKAPAKTVIKKPAAKKAIVKAKAPVKKGTVKKTVAKTVKKAVAVKKPVKTPVKKPAAKAVSKSTAAKKPVKKVSAPVKKTVAKPKAKTAATVKAKKPLAVRTPSAVKASTNISKNVSTPSKTAEKAVSQKPIQKPVAHAVANKTMKPMPVIKAMPPKAITQKTTSTMTLPIVRPDYEPSENEEFMNPVMKEYFRQRLIAWRDDLLRESEETLHILQEEGNMQKPDITDRASEETDLAIEFRTRDRERKLLNKIGEAMTRIDDGSYGYCEETGDAIPVKRLIARPTATMTLEAQELHERREKTQRDTYE